MAEIVANAEMPIRRPLVEGFDAFVDPSVTSRFWFSDGSGQLEPGKRIKWTWRWYGFSVDANVKVVEPNKRILVEWSGYGYPTPIQWVFTDRPDGTTFIKVTNKEFQGSVEKVAQMAVDATEGLAGAWHTAEPCAGPLSGWIAVRLSDGCSRRKAVSPSRQGLMRLEILLKTRRVARRLLGAAPSGYSGHRQRRRHRTKSRQPDQLGRRMMSSLPARTRAFLVVEPISASTAQTPSRSTSHRSGFDRVAAHSNFRA
jgi:uncharacterized protein YndB with AHSA1/START domain